jgi:predicted enzyme related to lactoylglutathione lyase
MADTNGVAAGTPSWIDLGSPDVDASVKFYGDLFGWTADPGSTEFGGYRMLRSGGKQVAGVGPLMNPQQPPAWTTYMSVDDAKATSEKAKKAGGQVLVETMQVGDAGSMAILQDPTGAVFGLWQPDQHKGAELFNTPVSLTWNELSTRDPEAAKRFYSVVFGWDPQTHGEGSEAYTEWHLSGKSIGGMMQTPAQVPAAVPPHWLTYFTVSDTEATVKKAQELGAQVLVPPTTIPQGVFAVLTDPAGAAFAVIKPA